MNNKKHAYLIIAHNQFDILEKLIELVDDVRNDIYIHIDKTVKEFDFEYFEKLPKNSNIKIIQEINVCWGGYSQIECELLLLENSCCEIYEYYHFLSGVDLPIKTQDYIHNFFENNYGKEFITFWKIRNHDKLRYKDIFIFNNYMRHNNFLILKTTHILRWGVKQLNKHIKLFDNENNDLEIKYGSNWVSITNEFVKYILNNKKTIKKTFKYSSCGDEFFIHTLAYNSKFRENIYDSTEYEQIETSLQLGSLREIDWIKGNPYIFNEEDINRLKETNSIFARKFITNNYNIIINEVLKIDIHK